MPCWPVGLGRCRCMVAVLLVFVVCLAVVLVLRVVLENVKFDLNDKPLCNLAGLMEQGANHGSQGDATST